MSEDRLCPFSKPIIGNWCQCPHARLAERCSGKMDCAQADVQRPRCQELSAQLHHHSRFALGLRDQDDELTHAQSMKLRCGGLLGIQRVLGQQDGPPKVPELISQLQSRFTSMDKFPYQEIMPDIQGFSHRRKSTA